MATFASFMVATDPPEDDDDDDDDDDNDVEQLEWRRRFESTLASSSC